LDDHIPRGKQPWERANFDIRVAGPRIEILSSFLPPDYATRGQPAQRDALVPLILRAREARATGRHAIRGLWHRARLTLSPDGVAQLAGDWESEPGFEAGGRVTKAELDADLARFPRSPRWREPWMDDLK
jgi:hypothetical protein